MNPEIYEYLMEVLLKKGALDVALIPVQMKKNRPGIILKVIARESDKTELIEKIFNETTSIGVRAHTVERYILSPKTNVVDTPWGKVRVKIIEEPEGRNFSTLPSMKIVKKSRVQKIFR